MFCGINQKYECPLEPVNLKDAIPVQQMIGIFRISKARCDVISKGGEKKVSLKGDIYIPWGWNIATSVRKRSKRIYIKADIPGEFHFFQEYVFPNNVFRG